MKAQPTRDKDEFRATLMFSRHFVLDYVGKRYIAGISEDIHDILLSKALRYLADEQFAKISVPIRNRVRHVVGIRSWYSIYELKAL